MHHHLKCVHTPEQIVGFILLVIGIVIESWYWFIYFPRAWATKGTNREIDIIRDIVTDDFDWRLHS